MGKHPNFPVLDGGEGAFPASAHVPGQARSREVYEAVSGRLSAMPWYEDYLELRSMKLDWRKAAYVAWASSPGREREPATQGELASMLGLSSDRTIRGWREKQPELDELVAMAQMAPLVKHRRDVVEALVAAASNPAGANSSDRRLFFALTGDLEEKSQQRIVGSETEPGVHIYIPSNGRDDPAAGGAADGVSE